MNKKSCIPPHLAQSTKIPSPKRLGSVLSRPRCSLQSPPQRQQLNTWIGNHTTTTTSAQYKPLAVPALAHSSTTQSQLTESPSNMSLFVFDDTFADPGNTTSCTPRGGPLLAASDSGAILQDIKYVPSRASSQALPLPSSSRGSGLASALSQQRSSKGNSIMSANERAMTIRPVISYDDDSKKLLAGHNSSSSSLRARSNHDEDKENNLPSNTQQRATGTKPSTTGLNSLAGTVSLGRGIGGNLLDDHDKHTYSDDDSDLQGGHRRPAATPASVSLRLS